MDSYVHETKWKHKNDQDGNIFQKQMSFAWTNILQTPRTHHLGRLIFWRKPWYCNSSHSFTHEQSNQLNLAYWVGGV